jgi:hypothetical protein
LRGEVVLADAAELIAAVVAFDDVNGAVLAGSLGHADRLVEAADDALDGVRGAQRAARQADKGGERCGGDELQATHDDSQDEVLLLCFDASLLNSADSQTAICYVGRGAAVDRVVLTAPQADRQRVDSGPKTLLFHLLHLFDPQLDDMRSFRFATPADPPINPRLMHPTTPTPATADASELASGTGV